MTGPKNKKLTDKSKEITDREINEVINRAIEMRARRYAIEQDNQSGGFLEHQLIEIRKMLMLRGLKRQSWHLRIRRNDERILSRLRKCNVRL